MSVDIPDETRPSLKAETFVSATNNSYFSGEVEPSSKNDLLDPDLELQKKKHEFDSSDKYHSFKMFAFTVGSRILFFGGIIILFVIFFVIMPFSEMDLTAESRIEWIQNYSSAFLQALGSFGITVLAVIVSELLKLLYKFMRSNRKAE